MKQLFDRPIAFQRIFVRLTGSVNAALMLSQACYWQLRTDGDWYKTQQDWESETGLSRREQESARRVLRQFPEFWREQLRGTPARLYYFVDLQALQDAISSLDCQTSLYKTAKQVCTKPPNKFVQNRQTSLADSAMLYNVVTETKHETKHETNTDNGECASQLAPIAETGSPSKSLTPLNEMERYWQEFLSVYPPRAGDRKVAKGKEKFISLIKSGVPPEKIITGARTYGEFCRATGAAGTQFVKMIPTFLNNRSWEEEYVPAAISERKNSLLEDYREKFG